MSSGQTSGTASKTPAPWSEFPDYEEFWNAYVDTFWGTGGNTSFHDMITEDIEHLKQTYLQNNESLTKLENDYINDLKRSDYEFEEEIRGSQIPVRFGGGPAINLVPKGARYTAEKAREHATDTSAQRLALGDRQAGRIMDYGKEFTPNKAEIAHMEYLRQLGSEGQGLRMGMPTVTETGEADYDPDLLETFGGYASIGANIAEAGRDSGFWGWLGKKDWFDSGPSVWDATVV